MEAPAIVSTPVNLDAEVFIQWKADNFSSNFGLHARQSSYKIFPVAFFGRQRLFCFPASLKALLPLPLSHPDLDKKKERNDKGGRGEKS